MTLDESRWGVGGVGCKGGEGGKEALGEGCVCVCVCMLKDVQALLKSRAWHMFWLMFSLTDVFFFSKHFKAPSKSEAINHTVKMSDWAAAINKAGRRRGNKVRAEVRRHV